MPQASPSPSEVRLTEVSVMAAGVAGTALLAWVSQHYRIDRVRCGAWPPIGESAGWAAVYLGGVALLTWAWLRAQALPRATPVGRVLLLALPIHLVALAGAPFLSDDAVCYGAIGRVIAAYGRDPYALFRTTLPVDDPFFELLRSQGTWLDTPSAYLPGFNALARVVAVLAGSDVALHLRLYQIVAAGALFAAAAITGAAAGSRAAALLALCPLTVVEGTMNGHNDALLALGTAGFALAVARRWAAPVGLAALASGLFVKSSALLLLALDGLALALARWRMPRAPAARIALAATACTAGVGLWLALAHTPALAITFRLFGRPDAPYDYCTRSVECLPRVVLRWLLHAPTAAWAVGLAFRVAGGLWLLWCAARAARDGRVLHWSATFLLIYYLYLHAWAQSWYLLALLPLLPFTDGRIGRAARVACVSTVAYYALLLPWRCVTTPLGIALADLVQAAVAIIPPTVVLFRRDRDGSR